MMNWIYNWYDPSGKLKVDDLAQHLTQLFVAGFSPGLPLQPATSAVLPKNQDDLSIWRGTAN
jgi:hypothetical protein